MEYITQPFDRNLFLNNYKIMFIANVKVSAEFSWCYTFARYKINLSSPCGSPERLDSPGRILSAKKLLRKRRKIDR